MAHRHFRAIVSRNLAHGTETFEGKYCHVNLAQGKEAFQDNSVT